MKLTRVIFHQVLLLWLGVSAIIVLVGCREDLISPPSTFQTLDFKGFSYTSFEVDGFTQGAVASRLNELKAQTATSWVALCVAEYQSSSSSSDIAPNSTGTNPLTGAVWSKSSTEADIRAGAEDALRNGLRVMLKPHIDLYNGQWRASINPGSGWFTAYTTMIIKYARLAQELGLGVLCIGDELVIATQPANTSRWRDLIDTVRGVFNGKLVYAANWSGAPEFGIVTPEYQNIQFWDAIDYIGIDAYYPLTSSPSDGTPGIFEATVRMQEPVAQIAAISRRFDRKVIITEIGIQSVQGALSAPWDYGRGSASNAVIDTSAQAFYYEVMISTLGSQSWCAGMFWWNWESVPTSNERTNYTLRNKPAAKVVRVWYVQQGS